MYILYICLLVYINRSRKDLYANITPDYYGYRDEIWATGATAQDTTSAVNDVVALGLTEHNVLQAKEKEMESYWRSQAEIDYANKKRARLNAYTMGEGNVGGDDNEEEDSSSSSEEEEVC